MKKLFLLMGLLSIGALVYGSTIDLAKIEASLPSDETDLILEMADIYIAKKEVLSAQELNALLVCFRDKLEQTWWKKTWSTPAALGQYFDNGCRNSIGVADRSNDSHIQAAPIAPVVLPEAVAPMTPSNLQKTPRVESSSTKKKLLSKRRPAYLWGCVNVSAIEGAQLITSMKNEIREVLGDRTVWAKMTLEVRVKLVKALQKLLRTYSKQSSVKFAHKAIDDLVGLPIKECSLQKDLQIFFDTAASHVICPEIRLSMGSQLVEAFGFPAQETAQEIVDEWTSLLDAIKQSSFDRETIGCYMSRLNKILSLSKKYPGIENFLPKGLACSFTAVDNLSTACLVLAGRARALGHPDDAQKYNAIDVPIFSPEKPKTVTMQDDVVPSAILIDDGDVLTVQPIVTQEKILAPKKSGLQKKATLKKKPLSLLTPQLLLESAKSVTVAKSAMMPSVVTTMISGVPKSLVSNPMAKEEMVAKKKVVPLMTSSSAFTRNAGFGIAAVSMSHLAYLAITGHLGKRFSHMARLVKSANARSNITRKERISAYLTALATIGVAAGVTIAGIGHRGMKCVKHTD